MLSNSPRLWLVATPIGNPGDLTDRAKAILSAAELICAEDTREAGILCKRHGIQKKRFYSLFEHNEEQRLETILSFLENGGHVALISNAGSPLIADPGYLLVRACREHGFPVSPVPGPSAPIAALTASGLPPSPFSFLGFLPRKAGDQRRTLTPFAELKTTLIFFERKSRLRTTLGRALEVLGDREACLCRELTKCHEEFIFFRLAEIEGLRFEMLGEFTVIIGPPDACETSPQIEVEALIRRQIQSGRRPAESVQEVLKQTRGWDRKSVYRVYTEVQRRKC